MKWFLLVLLAGCEGGPKIGGTSNHYEMITVGPYTCVSIMAFQKPGGLWCERTKREKK